MSKADFDMTGLEELSSKLMLPSTISQGLPRKAW